METITVNPKVEQAERLAAWLSTLDRVTGARPVIVTIKATAYYGAEYTDNLSFGETRLYLLAEDLPKCYKRRKSLCFTREGDAEDWYIAGWYFGDNPNVIEFHPFGKHFNIHRWYIRDMPQCKIDSYERYDYLRVPMQVLYI